MRATFVRKMDGWKGDARLYRVEPPIAHDEGEQPADYVIVSAVVAYGGPETYIFAADETGLILNWGELGGSFRGGLDHRAALDGAGYEVCDEVPR